ncbi:MAG: glycosyltransferase [Saprospiraceae bacterium]
MVKVSVIMTFFNESESLLKRSVDSILNQTFQDFEFIIIAGNPENSPAIDYLKTLSSEQKKILFHVADSKLRMATCLNWAIRLASGKYIAIQESDDASFRERLERELYFMEQDDRIDIMGTSIAYINDADQKHIVTRYYPEHPRKAFNKYTAIAHPTILVKRELYEKYGYYNENEEVRNSPDHELWCRWIIQGVRFFNIPDVLFNYYQSAENGRNKNAKKTLRSVVRLKTMYATQMKFTFSDYIYLWMEKSLLLLPQSIISKVFYVWIRFKRVR